MANMKPYVFVLLCFVLLVTAAIAYETNEKDPRVEICKQQCRQQAGDDKWQQQTCRRRCEQSRGGSGRGGSDIMEESDTQSPRERLRECQQQCDRRGQQHQPECRRQCEERYKQEQQEQGQGQQQQGQGRGQGGQGQGQGQEGRGQGGQGQEGRGQGGRGQGQEGRGQGQEGRGQGGRGQGQEGRGQSQDPQKQYQACRKQCQRESQQGQRQERERCEQRCEEQLREHEKEGSPRNPMYEGEEERQQQDENPYVFDDRHLVTSAKSQHGRLRVLKRFDRHSKYLRGLRNYRLEILEANPQAFLLPHHCDADTVIFVAQGRATISLVHAERRESLNLRHGDVLRIRTGTTVYLINRDNNERLVLAKLVQPVNIPGRFEHFVGVGGENQESYLSTFSSELIEAAFNTNRDRVKRLLGQQSQGVIIKASEEQIRALSRHQEGGIWPFTESKGATNLFQQHPVESNEFGELREVTPNDYKELEDLDVAVSFANVTQGAMITPFYNSRSTKIVIVLKGQGHMETACPHLSSSRSESEEEESYQGGQQQQGDRKGYQKLRAQLRQGMVVVVPVGHPVISVASGNQNLEMVCFDINARNNERVPLAGRRNIWNQLEREAKELSFGIPAREVESILQNQKQEWFFPGPRQRTQQHEGRADE